MSVLQDLKRTYGQTYRTIAKVIYRSESNATKVGASAVVDLLDKYIAELRSDKKRTSAVKALKRISAKIQGGMPRHKAYSGYLPPQMVEFLEIADEHKIDPSEIFKRYVPIQEDTDSLLRSIRAKMVMPLLIFSFAVVAVGKIVSVFQGIREDGVIHFMPYMNFVMDHYMTINVTYAALFIVFFILFPSKVPMIRGVMKEVEAIFALLAVEVYGMLGMPAGNIAKQIRRQFKIKTRRIGEDIHGLIRLLRGADYIDSLQGAELKIQAENQKLKDGVSLILDEKVKELEIQKDRLNSAVSLLSMLMLIVPVAMGVSLILGMMLSTSDLISQ